LILLLFLLLMFLVSIGAGLLGALVGLGGGVVIIPILTVLFGVDIHLAIGASIISVIATSSGAGATYVRDKVTNIRVGMFLQVAASSGALLGAAVASYVNATILEAVFGVVLLLSLIPLTIRFGDSLRPELTPVGLVRRLKLYGSYTERDGTNVSYAASGVGRGLLGMGFAGLVSGMLGIGSGVFKVLSLDLGMKLPIKVSTATSNFMIGVTAASSAGIYFVRGDVNPVIVAPVATGILLGALLGSRLLLVSSNITIRRTFAILLAVSAVEMIARSLGL
jgi:uncharacterized membrane protein YfcA